MNVIQEIETRLPEEAVSGFRRLIGQARVGDPILLQERAMARMVAPAQWILTRVGVDGIRLTPAGHLPPAVVVDASTELDWGWPISVNREVHLRPLQELRGHLRDVGLLRVSKGMLLLTKNGRAASASPRELWWHLARTMFEQTEAWHGDRGTVTVGGAAFARAALLSEAPTESPTD